MSITHGRSLGMALVIALMASAALATAAHAESKEGPYSFANGEQLVSGATREVKAAEKMAFVLKDTTAKVKVECTGLKFKSGATLIGSESKSSGKGSEVLEFSSCLGGASEESTKGCEPEGGKITSAALLDTTGYATESRSGKILLLIAPESGTTLANVKFSGASCVTKTATLAGKLIGEAGSEGKPIEVGKNETEAVKQELTLGKAEEIWTESEGTLTAVKSTLSLSEGKATLEGQATLELVSAEQWVVAALPEQLPHGYSFGFPSVTYNLVAGEERGFTLHNYSSKTLELRKVKLVGAESAFYEITDKHFCTTSTFGQLGHCELTIKLLNGGAGGALVEGEVLFGDGYHHTFAAKDLVN